MAIVMFEMIAFGFQGVCLQAEEPTLGAVLARRYVAILGSAEELAIGIQQALREAGWEHIPIGEILGDGAPWIWNVADAYVPGVGQTLDDSHLSEHLSAFAQLLYPNNPAGAKAWVDAKMGALLTDRVGTVLRALKRMRPWKRAICDALAQMVGYMEYNRTRIRDHEPWHSGLAVGSGSEGTPIAMFPHHTHVGERVIAAQRPALRTLLAEIRRRSRRR